MIAHLAEAWLRSGRSAEALATGQRAVALARERGERGFEAHALRILGAQSDHPDAEAAEARYRHALAVADGLGMRPLLAHCRLGLGQLYTRTGKREQAREHLTTAATM
jgi:tetratricopeptide (TPR) repeat protein